jgi:hypothetical protein
MSSASVDMPWDIFSRARLSWCLVRWFPCRSSRRNGVRHSMIFNLNQRRAARLPVQRRRSTVRYDIGSSLFGRTLISGSYSVRLLLRYAGILRVCRPRASLGAYRLPGNARDDAVQRVVDKGASRNGLRRLCRIIEARPRCSPASPYEVTAAVVRDCEVVGAGQAVTG